MNVTVSIPEILGKSGVYELANDSFEELLEKVMPGRSARLFDDKGRLVSFVKIFINEQCIQSVHNLQLSSNDRIDFLCPQSGG